MQWVVDSPSRLDIAVFEQAELYSRGKAQSLIVDGHVSVNDSVVTKSSYMLQAGDRIVLTIPDTVSDTSLPPTDLSLSILYEDRACLVVEKPAGVSVHPGAGMEEDEVTLLHGIAHLFKTKKIPFHSEAVLVHRLDKETTGCILIAKSPEHHLALQKQFEARTVEKIYLVIAAGQVTPSAAVIDAPIGRSTANRTKMAVRGTSAARDAKTTYRVLDQSKDAALLECELHTGRTHQIRVHLFSIGFPILGDPSYENALSKKVAKKLSIDHLCLHAWKLAFTSPATGKKEHVIAPLDDMFTDSLIRAGLNAPA